MQSPQDDGDVVRTEDWHYQCSHHKTMVMWLGHRTGINSDAVTLQDYGDVVRTENS